MARQTKTAAWLQGWSDGYFDRRDPVKFTEAEMPDYLAGAATGRQEAYRDTHRISRPAASAA